MGAPCNSTTTAHSLTHTHTHTHKQITPARLFSPFAFFLSSISSSGKYPGMLALDLALLVAMFMYLTEPCLMYLFAPWLLRKKTEMDTQEPWRTLNDGFTSRWVQGILTIAFFGIFVVLYASWGPWTGIPPP